MSRHSEFETNNIVRTQDEIFLFKEPIVLLTIICSTVSHGIASSVQNLWIEGGSLKNLLELWSVSATAIPMVGILFFAFLSEVHGRKPIFIALFALSMLSDIALSLPWREILYVSLPYQGLLRGGLRVMGTLAITEYCTPKHRFAYMLGNSMVLTTISSLTSILFKSYPTSFPYVLSFQILLRLVCLVSACKWPESPYWLASKGKLEDSRKAFFWLRGEEGREERNSLFKERRSQGPLKLYWTAFFVSIATTSVAISSGLGSRFWQRYNVALASYQNLLYVERIMRSCGGIVIASLIIIVSYFVKRKVLFLLISGISTLFSYGISIWIHVDSKVTLDEAANQLFYILFYISNTISFSGLGVLSIVLSIEIVPLKYNTHMACIVMLCNYIVYFPFWTLFWRTFVDFESSHAYLPIFTTLALFGVLAYCCLAPEAKDKTLLEIQKAYTPELNKENFEEGHETTRC